MNKTPYNQLDHSHCWTSDNPPCGQKIEHYKCCLCEKLNPMIEETLHDYTNFLCKWSYTDSDVWSEEPKAVDRYLDSLEVK